MTNIVNVTNITGKVSGQAVLATPSAAIIPNIAANHTAKVNALYVSNVDGANSALCDVYVTPDSGSTKYYIIKEVVIPVDSAIDVLSKSIYLESGWSLWIKAGADLDLEAVASWEDMTDQ